MDLLKLQLQGAYSSRCKIVLTVGSGSAHEPEHWPGLAHWLEHALFLGSESREETLPAGAIQAELLQMGGSINASTQLFHTSYMLDCPADHFERALRLLCLLVLSPQFDDASVLAELDIIDAEYWARCGDSWQQTQAVVQQLSPDTHPLHRFCAGNKASLSGDADRLLVALKTFYLTHYRLDNISFFIQHPALDHDADFFQRLGLTQGRMYDELGLRAYLEQQLEQILSLANPRPGLIAETCANEVVDETLSDQPTVQGCPSLRLEPKQYAVALANSGYEWCWVLPNLLLPAVDQLSLPEHFQARIRMLSPEELLLGIQLKSALTLSLNDMETEHQFLIEQIELLPHSSAEPSLMQVVQQALYYHYDLPIIQPDILKKSLIRYLSRPAQLQFISHPKVQGEQQTANFPTFYQAIDTDYPALPPNNDSVQMPFIALRHRLMQGATLNFDEVEVVSNDDPFNHAALIWLQPTLNASALLPELTALQLKQAEKRVAHQVVWHYQQKAYVQLRVEQRLGYVVHFGYHEIAQQSGLLLLIQGRASTPSAVLLKALRSFLAQIDLQQEWVVGVDKAQHWQSYVRDHQLTQSPVELEWLPVQCWNQVQMISSDAP